jgi:hypothetical protein
MSSENCYARTIETCRIHFSGFPDLEISRLRSGVSSCYIIYSAAPCRYQVSLGVQVRFASCKLHDLQYAAAPSFVYLAASTGGHISGPANCYHKRTRDSRAMLVGSLPSSMLSQNVHSITVTMICAVDRVLVRSNKPLSTAKNQIKTT